VASFLTNIRDSPAVIRGSTQGHYMLDPGSLDGITQQIGETQAELADIEQSIARAYANAAEDFSRDVAEVSELRVAERHGLFAQATQRLAMLLSEPATLLGTLAVSTGEPACEVLLRRRRSRLRAGRGYLGSRCAHVCIVIAERLAGEFSPAP
jgi:hypothetical protein